MIWFANFTKFHEAEAVPNTPLIQVVQYVDVQTAHMARPGPSPLRPDTISSKPRLTRFDLPDVSCLLANNGRGLNTTF